MLRKPSKHVPGQSRSKATAKSQRWRGMTLAAVLWVMAAPSARADIAVTLPPLAGLVIMLDANAEVFCLLPANADPHHVQLAPRRIERLHQAQLLVRASRDDSAWHGLGGARQVLDLWPDHDHAWLDPERVRAALPRLAAALARAAPQRRHVIQAQLERALAVCNRLERQLRQALAAYEDAGVILQHAAWRRPLLRRGVPVLAVLEPQQHGREQRPRALEQALAIVRNHAGVKLWGDVKSANRALKWLATRAPDHDPILLDAVGECGLPWQELMQRNIAAMSQP